MNTDQGILGGHCKLTTFVTVPYRDSVSPPQLAADAPVANVLQPVKVDLGKALRDDPDPAIRYRIDCWNCQGRYADEPLLAGPRFDNGVAAAAMPH